MYDCNWVEYHLTNSGESPTNKYQIFFSYGVSKGLENDTILTDNKDMKYMNVKNVETINKKYL